MASKDHPEAEASDPKRGQGEPKPPTSAQMREGILKGNKEDQSTAPATHGTSAAADTAPSGLKETQRGISQAYAELLDAAKAQHNPTDRLHAAIMECDHQLAKK